MDLDSDQIAALSAVRKPVDELPELVQWLFGEVLRLRDEIWMLEQMVKEGRL
jgi:hypothetical protein